MMQHWDPVASTLPDAVQRLVTLRDLHEQGEGLEVLPKDLDNLMK